MRLVILESPYAGNVARNLRYARAALRDCLFRGEAPFASHLLYTQDGILTDALEAERSLGISAGLWWARFAEATVVYDDFGVSGGMEIGIADAVLKNRPVEYRKLDPKILKIIEARR